MSIYRYSSNDGIVILKSLSNISILRYRHIESCYCSFLSSGLRDAFLIHRRSISFLSLLSLRDAFLIYRSPFNWLLLLTSICYFFYRSFLSYSSSLANSKSKTSSLSFSLYWLSSLFGWDVFYVIQGFYHLDGFWLPAWSVNYVLCTGVSRLEGSVKISFK